MIKVTDEIREAARRLLLDRHNASDIAILEAIAAGKRKLIRWEWWSKFYAAFDRAKRDKIAAMADPARNDKEHERKVAEAKLKAMKARRPPGSPPEPPPIDWSPAAMMRRREWVKEQRRKKRKASPSSQSSDSVASGSASDSVARLAKPAPVQRPSDSVAAPIKSDSVAAAPVKPAPAKPAPVKSDSVARPDASNQRRAAQREAKRTGLTCQTCGKPLAAAQRATAKFCSPTCRSQAWRKIPK